VLFHINNGLYIVVLVKSLVVSVVGAVWRWHINVDRSIWSRHIGIDRSIDRGNLPVDRPIWRRHINVDRSIWSRHIGIDRPIDRGNLPVDRPIWRRHVSIDRSDRRDRTSIVNFLRSLNVFQSQTLSLSDWHLLVSLIFRLSR